jgi:hypothetical protein
MYPDGLLPTSTSGARPPVIIPSADGAGRGPLGVSAATDIKLKDYAQR